MTKREFDCIVFGASGFTAIRVIRYLSSVKPAPSFAFAGRNPQKIKDAVEVTKPIIKADVSDYDSLITMTKRCNVLLNCVGPYRLYGEPVVKACIETGTDYVDITGEPLFIEGMYLKYDEMAKYAGVAIISACGFDSIPTDLGVLFIKNSLKEEGVTPVSVEMFFELRGGADGVSGNYGTFESLIYGISSGKQLKDVRRGIDEKLPTVPKVGKSLKFHKLPHYDQRVKSWVIPFFFADPSVVRLSQRLVEAGVWSERIQGKPVPKPVQFAAYVKLSLLGIFGFAIFGIILSVFSVFERGRKILLDYGEYITLGGFKKQGPTEAQIMSTDFKSTFLVKGSKGSSTNETNYSATFSVIGKEPGYVTTPICMVESALVMLNEREKIPSGVVTPSVAFGGTTLIKRLQSGGLQFKKE